MSRLTLWLLGPPRIERNGAPIEVDTRKAIALLAYLAVTGRAHSRDTLAALLWPEYDQASARASLRRTLSALKKALADDWLEIERETIGLKRGPGLWIDVEHFRARLAETASHGHPGTQACAECVPPLSEAVETFRGDFLAGFATRDSSDFEDWQSYQAEALGRELSVALRRLVDALCAQGAYDRATAYARRWLALDPLNEQAHRQLMLLHAWAGDRSSALRQYRECVRTLETELGVTPLAETTALYEAIREGRVSEAPDGETGRRGDGEQEAGGAGLRARAGRDARATAGLPLPHSPRRTQLPLVGRGAQLAAMLEVYRAASDGGHVLALEGEAGIGKTRLAEELLTHARSAGAGVVATRCYEGETTLAYGPLVEAVRAGIRFPGGSERLAGVPDHWLSEAARLLPELGGVRPSMAAAPELDSPGAQARFFEGVGQVLLALTSGVTGTRGILFLDDLHWCDEASLDVLTYLVRRLGDRPMLVLATWRTEHVPTTHRLRRLLAEAHRAASATSLTLPRLTADEVAELARSASTPQDTQTPAFGEALYRETEGLPFFVVEYLGALATGAPADGSLPVGVRELLRSRLAQVGQVSMQLLTTAAVIGRSFDFETLREASGRAEEETIGALEELIACRLIRELDSAGAPALAYDFTHDRLRELVYGETSLTRRRLLHGRVAESLLARARRAHQDWTPASQIAFHYQLAGRSADAAEFFRRAGQQAQELYANAEALAHYRSALALGHADPAGLHEDIGDLLTLGGQYAAALASYETAAAVSNPARLAALEHRLANLACRRGEWKLAESHFEAAESGLGAASQAGERARLYADWSYAAHRRGRAEQAWDLARRALELAETTDDAQALAQASNVLGVLHTRQGDLDAARTHLERSLGLAEQLGDSAARAAALNNLALVYGAGRALESAMELAEAALAACVARGDRHREAAVHNNLADLLRAAGRAEASMSHLKQAVTIFADVGGDTGSLQPEIWKLTEW